MNRADAQGGDRYPKHGADQSDRVLPQDRRKPDRTGQTGVRGPRSSGKPANPSAELPRGPKAGAFGCGHRNRKGKKQGTDLMESLFPAFAISFPTDAVPGFLYGYPFSALPFPLSVDRDPGCPRMRTSCPSRRKGLRSSGKSLRGTLLETMYAQSCIPRYRIPRWERTRKSPGNRSEMRHAAV